MTFRSALVLTAVAAIGVTACSTNTDSSVPELESATVETNACPTIGGCWADPDEPVLDPNTPDFYCKCGAPGPNGGFLVVKNGQCIEQTKKCCPGMGYCPPSRFISVYNPCSYPTPYYRCNAYGDCWCSPYP